MAVYDPYLREPSAWPSIDPGELRHRLTFLVPVNVSDASGISVQYVPATPPLITRARMRVLRGEEAIQGGQDVTEETAIFTVRYRAEIQASQRFVDEHGSTWLIKYIKNLGARRRLLDLVCVALGPNK